MPAHVAWLTIAPVKGLALVARDEVELTEAGASGDRRFYLVDASGRLANGKRFGSPFAVVPEVDERAGTLRLQGPNGLDLTAPVALGEPIVTSFYGRPVTGRVVHGPFGEALSEVVGTDVRLVEADVPGDGIDRGGGAAVTMLGTGSLQRLAAEAGVDAVDPRRFRMLVGVDGLAAHEEDGWIGLPVAVGAAVVEVTGNVGRCTVTTKNPESGVSDLPTLRLLSRYRGVMETTEPLPFGVVGRVLSPGRIAVGDAVAPA